VSDLNFFTASKGTKFLLATRVKPDDRNRKGHHSVGILPDSDMAIS